MYYPEYVMIFYNWYLDYWWSGESNCADKLNNKNLEMVLRRSLVVDHAPRIEDQDANRPNIGNIVSNIPSYL